MSRDAYHPSVLSCSGMCLAEGFKVDLAEACVANNTHAGMLMFNSCRSGLMSHVTLHLKDNVTCKMQALARADQPMTLA